MRAHFDNVKPEPLFRPQSGLRILINGYQELDPNIFTQRARLDSMETEELTLLAVMLSGTDFALPILEEIKKRS